MSEELFQELKSDMFQQNFLPGRSIPSHDVNWNEIENVDPLVQRPYFINEASGAYWMTIVYKSQFYAERAAKILPTKGLRVYYPKCRSKEKEIQASHMKRNASIKEPPKFVPAYGRYLFVQLPEDQNTFELLTVDEEFLAGPFNQNGLDHVLSALGSISLTRDDEIIQNRNYHSELLKKTDPKFALRFTAGETVYVKDGNLQGYFVIILNNIPMGFKLKSKIEVGIGKSGARHYVKVGSLEKVRQALTIP